MMKVLAINGSARTNGNTSALLQLVLEELRAEGFATGLMHLRDKPVGSCQACYGCRGRRRCILDDDFNDFLEAMIAADGILLGSPVYSADVSAIMKALLERAGIVAATNPGLFKYKAGASLAAVRRGGGMHAVDTMNHFFLNKEMFVVGSTYWNMVYGREPGEALADTEGVANIRNIGRNMAWLLKKTAR